MGILTRKRAKRRQQRDRQWQEWQRTGKRGNLREFRRQQAAIKYLNKLIAKRRAKLHELFRPGPPGWGGGKLIMAEVVWPIVKAAGITPTSGKRSETFGNPASDHYIGNRDAYAKDYATANNYALAQRIRSALTPGQAHADYADFYFTYRGKRFRGQVIAGTHGTGPHLHVGFRRV